MLIGSYSEISLSKTRERVKELSARVSLGYDVAGEKQEKKAEAVKKMEAEKNAKKFHQLTAEYFGKADTILEVLNVIDGVIVQDYKEAVKLRCR